MAGAAEALASPLASPHHVLDTRPMRHPSTDFAAKHESAIARPRQLWRRSDLVSFGEHLSSLPPNIDLHHFINGTAQIVKDADLLEGMAVNDKSPDLALLVRVKEAFFHCGKSMIRSRMWEPSRWGSIDGLPTYAQALKDHGNLSTTLQELEQRLAKNE